MKPFPCRRAVVAAIISIDGKKIWCSIGTWPPCTCCNLMACDSNGSVNMHFTDSQIAHFVIITIGCWKANATGSHHNCGQWAILIDHPFCLPLPICGMSDGPEIGWHVMSAKKWQIAGGNSMIRFGQAAPAYARLTLTYTLHTSASDGRVLATIQIMHEISPPKNTKNEHVLSPAADRENESDASCDANTAYCWETLLGFSALSSHRSLTEPRRNGKWNRSGCVVIGHASRSHRFVTVPLQHPTAASANFIQTHLSRRPLSVCVCVCESSARRSPA